MSNRFYLKNFGLVFLAVSLGFFPGSAHAGFQWVSPSSGGSASGAEAPVPQAESVAPVVTGAPEALAPVIIDGNNSSAPVVIEGSSAAKTDTSSSIVGSGNVPPSTGTRPGDSIRPGYIPPSSGSDSVFEQTPPKDSPLAVVPPPTSPAQSVTLSSSPPSPATPLHAGDDGFDPSTAPSLQPAPPMMPSNVKASGDSTHREDVVHGFANHVPLAVALRQILPTGYGFSIDQDIDLGLLVSFRGGKPWRETLDEAVAPVGLIVREQGQMVEVSYPADKQPAKASGAPDSGVVTLSSSAPAATQSPPMPSANLTPPSAMDEAALAMSLPSTPVEVSWDAEPGDSLHKVLESWAHRDNVEFDWMAEYDYPIQASIHLKGKFEDAVRELLTGFESAHPQPIAELHSNSKAGQMVLVVTTRGNTTD